MMTPWETAVEQLRDRAEAAERRVAELERRVAELEAERTAFAASMREATRGGSQRLVELERLCGEALWALEGSKSAVKQADVAAMLRAAGIEPQEPR